MRRYAVKSGDSMTKIAEHFYGDADLYLKLAEYNGLRDPDLIFVGQIIEIPSKTELLGGGASPPIIDHGLAPPHGLEEIIDTFGDIARHIATDGSLRPGWESQYLCHARLPFDMPLSWDHSKIVKRLYCHVKLKNIFVDVFAEIENLGLKGEIKTYGGCYNLRPKRTSNRYSTHSWGIAIDLNTDSNQMGTAGDMDVGIVEVFREYGFKWGGDWPGRSKDPMHFQFCTGY